MADRLHRWQLAGIMGLAALGLAGCLERPAPVLSPAPQVMTQAGPLTGVIQGEVRAYLGIPYAAPPVGQRRGRPPEPVSPWREPRAATAVGSGCMQPETRFVRLPEGMDEDCLTLNVWTPATGRQLPVLVWIHGGGYTVGSGADPLFDGRHLAARGAVVVTFNYRLGPFGFLAPPPSHAGTGQSKSDAQAVDLPQSSAAQWIPNLALHDQIAALRWVQRQIAAFGGDPARVTVFGQSAGGASIAALMASSASAGLFARAILQSGGAPELLADCTDGRAGPGAATRSVLQALDLPADAPALVARLRKIDAPRLVELWQQALRQEGMAGEGVRDQLCIDHDLLERSPMETFVAGRQSRIPTLIGVVADEGSVFAARLPLASASAYQRYLETAFGELGSRLAALYPAQPDTRRAASDLIGDLFVLNQTQTARAMMAVAPSWFYRFTLPSGAPLAAKLGSFHGSELRYLFATLDADAGTEARDLSRRMAGYWLAFARAGDPNHEGAPRWDRFLGEAPVLELRTQTRSGELPALQRLQDLERLRDRMLHRLDKTEAHEAR